MHTRIFPTSMLPLHHSPNPGYPRKIGVMETNISPEIRITAYQYFNRQHLRNCPSSKEIVRPTLIIDLSICPDATSREAVLLLQPRYSARPSMPCIRLDALCWCSARCSSIHSSNCATVSSVTIVVGVISISINILD